MNTIRRVILDNQEKELQGFNAIYHDPIGNRININELECLPPTKPRTIVCIHLNYRSRLNEMRRDQPEAPTYFLKPASCLNAHQKTVLRPHNCKYLNYEGEIALVVSQQAKNVDINEAHNYIKGYTIANDFGLHDFRETDQNSMVRVKGFRTLGAVGPDIFIGWNYKNKSIKTYVDEELVQESDTNDMIWSPEYLLADLSRSITFEDGDLILTGTPANSRPVNPGSIVKVAVEGLGTLENRIDEDPTALNTTWGAQPKDSSNIREVALGSDKY